ncbi:MAG TPA: hypothetical protein VIO64_21965 [Pseudobacteroides sp.]|uniref:PD-(D/E)XK nuclease domain-containing protein n=1 Tax=Pseudobacteroides sp. TaxID=1968840 RepID=UPI002F91E2AB
MKNSSRGNDKMIGFIDQQIQKGNAILIEYSKSSDIMMFKDSFDSWKSETLLKLNNLSHGQDILNDFARTTLIPNNRFSKKNMGDELRDAVRKGIVLLGYLKANIEEYQDNKVEINSIDRNTAIIIIKRILANFNKHIQAMYQDKLHRSGTIKREDLGKISIGNEYDVQRILYSLLRPIFPHARKEVYGDAGYSSNRYDIYLDEYNIVIEVKCTRENMTERKLSEELGSDAFHYKQEYIFLFIFDKVGVIQNSDAFIKGYRRDKSQFGKDVEAVVVQEVIL